jgi:hypothetical protein
MLGTLLATTSFGMELLESETASQGPQPTSVDVGAHLTASAVSACQSAPAQFTVERISS